MASLYELLRAKDELEEKLIESGGEISNLQEMLINDLNLKLPEKIDGWYRFMEILDSEISRLQARADLIKTVVKQLETAEDKANEHIKGIMVNEKIDRLDGDLFHFKLAKTAGSVVISNEDLIPKEYKKEVITISIDRSRIKQDLTLGVPVSGAYIQEGFSLRSGVLKKLGSKK